jgi:hypothetical protein
MCVWYEQPDSASTGLPGEGTTAERSLLCRALPTNAVLHRLLVSALSVVSHSRSEH